MPVFLRKAPQKYQSQNSGGGSSISSSSKNGSIARQTRQRSGDHRHGTSQQSNASPSGVTALALTPLTSQQH
jgi:hypothetical protein